MQHTSLGTFVLVVIAFGLTAVQGRCYAAEDHAAPKAAHPKDASAVTAETVGELWHAVKMQEAELGKLIQAKDLENVHELAFSIRDRVAALPGKSTQLSGEQLTKLKANVKYVGTLAERLDKTGDSKDQAGTEAGFKQLQSLLAAIEKLYPPEALK